MHATPDERERALAELRLMLGERCSTGLAAREHHGRSEAYHAVKLPDAVVFPESTEEVRRIVAVAGRARVPLVPFGAGTSLEGNASAPQGGICLDMMRMNRVLAVNQGDMDCRVQPGVTRKQLNAELHGSGLFFPIDPGADASIGGMSSTRASGTMAVRYGTMRENVLSLEAVMPDASVVRTRRRARKSAAGYDLTHLLVGSEGTLAVLTEITLRLHPLPEAVSAAVCPFGTLEDAVDCVIETMQAGVPVARIELLDSVMMHGVNLHSHLAYPEKPTLFFEFHGSESAVREQAGQVQAIAAGHGADAFQWATRPEDRSRLWHARENTLYAGMALRPGARAMITDVCVPISELARCLLETKQDIDASGLIVPIVGHVGDGNFHLLILIDPDDPAEVARAMRLQDAMVERALRLDGTCTGEHGIGTGKMHFLETELGDAVHVMRSVKRALDPRNIMNPGKIFRLES
ncbi:FAD-linked oxidase C-terminal domain-containing protein [Cupriavidus sp. 30B13]|uniref:FAD-linked oxidase C-terminal domain-containing protein n=1 Tax=Cupriavidus sp. 30B13 TaxID=3384241 RepID=UPI003B8F70B5